MEKDKNNDRLIKDLFKDHLKRNEIGTLSEIDIVEQRMEEQWEENAERVDPRIGEEIWDRIVREYKLGAKKRYLFHLRQPLIAACITLVLIIGGYFLYEKFYSLEKPEFMEIIASTEMLYVLPDSSKVWMQPESSIRFAKNFTEDRRVWLKGSSLFDVHHQSGSKFRVYIEKAFIEVRGTQFLVEKIEDGKDEITLFRGCIAFEVEPTGEQVVMQPLQQLLYDSSDSKVRTRNIDHIEWRDGKFTFNAMPLKRLLRIINQIYHTQIVFEGKGEDSPFSGTIRQDEPLEDVIDKICFLMNLRKEVAGERIILTN